MSILAVVVTYYPEIDLLKRNICSFIDYVDEVLIWENTPEFEKSKYRISVNGKIKYCGDGTNSISKALNYAWTYAKENGYEYILTMDQDSQWDDFRGFLDQTIFNSDAPLGLWGPNAYENIIPSGIMEFDKIITSGMLIKTDLVNYIGGWNEIFSIDCVDESFCLQAYRKGIKSYILGKCRLHQQYGTPKIVSFLGHSAIITYDSPRRLYSIYRSHVIQLRLFPEIRCIKTEFWGYWVPQIKWYVVRGKKPLSNLFAIFRGVLEGLVCKLS